MKDLGVPKTEEVKVRYCDSDGVLKFVLTGKRFTNGPFFLYEVNNGQLKKLGRSQSPLELEYTHKILDKLKKETK